MKCSICNGKIDKQFRSDGKMFWDKGHNPSPIKNGENDRCCSSCNDTVVIPARFKTLVNRRK